jgi:hypothetical protein
MSAHAPRLPFSLDPLIAEAKQRARRRRLLVAAGLVLVVAGTAAGVSATRSSGGPGSPGPSGTGTGLLSEPGRVGSVRIDPAGAIGPLRINRSSRAQVIAYAGEPSLFRIGKGDRGTTYEALGYGCAPGAGTGKYWSESLIGCRTDFYLVDGRLSLFFTQDRRFVEAAGIRIGAPELRAERLLRQTAIYGCAADLHVGNKRAWLTVALSGGKIRTLGTTSYLVGGHVRDFLFHGRLDPGVTDPGCD